MIRRHPRLSVVLAIYLGFVATVTLGPGHPSESDGWLLRVIQLLSRFDGTQWITYQRVEFTANVFLFFPIGMLALLLLGWRHATASVAFGVALTCAIEFAQKFIPGRVSDISDVISNSIGTALGASVATAYLLRQHYRGRGRRQMES